jgi:hypothetical protein
MLKFKSQMTDEEIPPLIILDLNKNATLEFDKYLEKYRNLITQNDLESVNLKLHSEYFTIMTDLSSYRIDFIELKILLNSIYLVLSHKYTNELYEYYLCTSIDNEL